MSEERVRDALAAIAGEVDHAPELWERTQHRIAANRRRRAGRTVAAALATTAAIVAAGVVVANDGNDGQPIAAGGGAIPVPGEVLAVVDGDVVVLSSDGGASDHVVVDGDAGFDAELGATADGNRLVYTRPGDPELDCSDDFRDLMLQGTPDERLVTATGSLLPLVSPDGRFVAFRMSECGLPSAVGLTALDTKANYQINANEDTELDDLPLAWTPDSQSLLVSLAGAYEIVSAPLGEERQSVDLPSGTHRAVFVSDDEVAIAHPQNGFDRVEIWNIRTGHRRDVLGLTTGQVTSLSFDSASRALLVVTAERGRTDDNLVLATLEYALVDEHGSPRVVQMAGLSSALWHRAPSPAADACVEIVESGGTIDECREVAVDEVVVVPDLRGLPSGDATAALRQVGLETAILDGGPRVVDQDPPPGSRIAPGSVVMLILGGVQPASEVPAVEGLDVGSARAALEEAGFTVAVESVASGGDDNDIVFWQEPPAGSVPIRARPVRIWSCGPAAECVSPPPSYVDGLEPTSHWRAIDLTEQRWSALAGPSPDAIGKAVEERIRAGFEQYETVSARAIVSIDTGDVWVRQRNSPDDSVDGQDFRLRIERQGDGWVVVSGAVRGICARGQGIGEGCV